MSLGFRILTCLGVTMVLSLMIISYRITSPATGNLTEGALHWQTVVPRTGWVFSAFLDTRGGWRRLQLITIVTRKKFPEVSCCVFSGGNQNRTPDYVTLAPASRKLGSGDYRSNVPGLRWWSGGVVGHFAHIYTCDLDDRQTYVHSVTLTTGNCEEPVNEVPVLQPRSSSDLSSSSESSSRFTSNFTVCVGTLFENYNDTHRLTEFIEFHRILGVNKFILYNNNVSRGLLRYMEFYRSKGVADIIPWKLPNDSGAFYHGQHAMLNDCLYRNMYTSKFVAFLDLDEMLVPGNRSNLNQLIELLKKDIKSTADNICGFSFRCKFFDLKDPNVNNFAILDDPEVDQYSIESLKNTRRRELILPNTVRSKLIVNPRLVDVMSVHVIEKPYGKCTTYEVPPEVATLHHYRRGLWQGSTEVTDRTMVLYAEDLIGNVSNIHRQMKGYQESRRFQEKFEGKSLTNKFDKKV